MATYILSFLIMITCHILFVIFSYKKNRIIANIIGIWIPIVILIALSTLKSNSVGIDTNVYYNLYLEAKNEPSIFTSNFNNFEIGFSLIFISFAKLNIPFKGFQFFLYSVIYLIFGYVLSKESKFPTFSIIIFCLWSWLFFNFSGIRQALSDMLCVFSAYFFLKKSNRKFINYLFGIVFYLLAITMHKSAVIFLVGLPLIYYLKISKNSFKNLMLIIMPAIICIYFMAPEIYQFFYGFLGINYYIPVMRTGVGELFFFYYAILFVAIIFSTQNLLVNKINDFFNRIDIKNSILRNSSEDSTDNFEIYTKGSIVLFSIGTIIQSFSYVCYSMTRFGNSFLILGCILIPNTIGKQKSKSLQIFAQVISIAVFVIIFYLDYYKTNQLNCIPYVFG